MPKKIDMSKWEAKYKKNAAAAGDEWYNDFMGATGIAAAASSDAAQKLYKDKMADDAVIAKRQKKLAKLTDEDFKAAVRIGGAALYKKGIEAKGGKAAKGFAPMAAVIDSVVAGLAPKGTDPEQNVLNRVLPLVKALAAKAKEG
ncbi:hypothetical protein D4R30_00365 [archaeon]|nr:MAG: hypothetical protein D4R30_00365 [archaeon]